MNQLLGLTQPQQTQQTPQSQMQMSPQQMQMIMQMMGQQQGGNPFQAAGLEQGFLGEAIGQGFGKLFGDSTGRVDLGGGNNFKSGEGFTQEAQGVPFEGQMPRGEGMDLNSFFGSMFG